MSKVFDNVQNDDSHNTGRLDERLHNKDAADAARAFRLRLDSLSPSARSSATARCDPANLLKIKVDFSLD